MTSMTVYEAVKFSARLRLSREMSDDEVLQRVDTVIEQLGIGSMTCLTHCPQ